MRYKISARVIYDATDNTLTLPECNEPDSQLSITAGALLYYFLRHTEVVSRDEVLKKVWDDNGLTSSNSNLNQYLSMLRKILRHYDVDNIILSASRGFLQLNPAVTIEQLTPEPVPLTEAAHEAAPTATLPAASETFNGFLDDKQGMYWYLAGFALLLMALFIVFLTMLNANSSQAIHFTRINTEPCELLTSDEMLHSVTAHLFRKNFDAVRQRLNLACHKGENFVFFYGDRLETNGLGRLFLAHCTTQRNKPFSYCQNYFYYAWES